jgi:hypothetical protein
MIGKAVVYELLQLSDCLGSISLEQSLLFGKLGTISQADAAQIKEIWQLYIKPQF